MANPGSEIREAIEAGMEVTFHERSINAHGWSGTGYSIVDPETGVGSYLIEGKGNGGYAHLYGMLFGIYAAVDLSLCILAGPAGIILFTQLAPVYILQLQKALSQYDGRDDLKACFWGGFLYAFGLVLTGVGLVGTLLGVTEIFGVLLTLIGLPAAYISGEFSNLKSGQECRTIAQ